MLFSLFYYYCCSGYETTFITMFSHRGFVTRLFSISLSWMYKKKRCGQDIWLHKYVFGIVNKFIWEIKWNDTTSTTTPAPCATLQLYILLLKELSISTFDDFTGGHWIGAHIDTKYRKYTILCSLVMLMHFKSIQNVERKRKK